MVFSDKNNSIVKVSSGMEVHYADERACSLLSERLDELCHPGANGWFEVKHNPSRSVWRGTLDGRDVYIKHFHSRSIIRRLARRIGISDARREFTVARHLRSYGVETAEVLAAVWSGIEWVLTAAVAPAQDGDKWHIDRINEGDAGIKSVRKASKALARMLARMHSAGVIHRDMHCGNVMVKPGDKPRVVLMDLHRVSCSRRLSRRQKTINLAQLCYDRTPFTTRTERLRFLKQYLHFSGARGSLRGWEMMVSFFASRHARRQLAHLDRRIFKTNRYFARVKLPRSWRGSVTKAFKRDLAFSRAADMTFSSDQWTDSLKNPQDLFSAPGLKVVKDARSGMVIRRTIRVGGGDVDVFIKHPLRKQFCKVLVDCFRPSRSLRAFALGHQLLNRRFATALPLAAIERRCGHVLFDNILITESVDTPVLFDYLKDAIAGGKWRLVHRVLWNLGRMLRRLHDEGFAHRDLKATNILVHTSDDGRTQFVLVDLDGLSKTRFLTFHRRLQDLARLNYTLLIMPGVNAAGRLRMLLGYLTQMGSGKINFKTYWRVIEQWSQGKVRRKSRKLQKPPTERVST